MRLARLLGRLALPACACAITLLVFEGAFAIRLWSQPSVSLSYKAYELALARFAANAGLRRDGTDVIERPAQFEALLDEFRSQGIGIGNTPYASLVTQESASNYVSDGSRSAWASTTTRRWPLAPRRSIPSSSTGTWASAAPTRPTSSATPSRRSAATRGDIAEVGHRAVARRGSLFAGLGLFVDAVHLSPEGTKRTVKRIVRELEATTARAVAAGAPPSGGAGASLPAS